MTLETTTTETEVQTPAPESITQETESPASESTETEEPSEPAAQEPEKPELSLKEKIEARAKELGFKPGEKPKPTLATRPEDKSKTPEKADKKGDVAPAAETPEEGKPKYEPNFKFRFKDAEHDVQREAEFPKWAQEACKDPETEKEIRSIFEKAYGLDFMKPRFQKAREENGVLRSEVNQYRTGIQELSRMYQEGNLEGVFERLKISEDKVLQYALDRAKYYELPPEQRQIIDARKNADRNAQLAQQQASSMESNYNNLLLRQRQMELDIAMSKPEFSEISKAFDARTGRPGSFLDAVAAHGEAVWYRSEGKIDLTPEQAISQVIALYGLQASAPGPAVTPATPAATPAPGQPAAAQATPSAPPAAQAPKVIPHVSGRASPAATSGKGPQSIQDIHRIRKEKFGS